MITFCTSLEMECKNRMVDEKNTLEKMKRAVFGYTTRF